MQRLFCFLALSAFFFACQRQQTGDELVAQIQAEAPPPAEGPETVEATPTPTILVATPSPVESMTPHPEGSVTSTARDTPILSATQTSTPTISSTPEATVQPPESSEKPVFISKPRLRLNPLSTGTPFPQATVSAELGLTSSSVISPVRSEAEPQAQETATETPATSSWIQNASNKKRAKPSVSPSPSP